MVAGLTIFAGCNSESSEARRIQANLDNLAKIKAENAAKQAASEDELYGTPIEAINFVKTQLKDPFSAQFQNVRHEGLGICGQVNAKNALGGYVGFRNFYVEKRRSYVEIEGAYSHQFCK